MPKAQEKALRLAGRKKGYKGKKLDTFIYGSLRASGWKPKRSKLKKTGKK
ncbi:MAG: hypothetical protein V3T23_12405 [Nitrososphaerales archaeon]